MGQLKIDTRSNISYIANPNNRDVYYKYLNEVSNLKPLSREEELEIFKKIKLTNSQVLKDKICKHNLLFVISVAKRYSMFVQKSTLTLEDLISEGNLGLYLAIDKFDYETGNKFISYAIWYIRMQILKCISDNIKSVRVPTNIQSTLRKLLTEEIRLEQKFGGVVDSQELFNEAKRLGIFSKKDKFGKILNIMGNSASDKSLSDLLHDEGTMEFSDTIKSEDSDPYEVTEKKELNEKIYKLFETVPNMPTNDKNFIILYFGLYDNDEPIPAEEITAIEENITRLEKEKLELIKSDSKEKDVIDCLKEEIISLKLKIKRFNKEPLTFREISEIYNITPESVRGRMNKWLRRIRNRNRSNSEYFRNNS